MLKIDNVTNEINDWINEKDYAIIPKNVFQIWIRTRAIAISRYIFLYNIVHEANLENDRSDFIRPKIKMELWTKFH